MIRERCELKKYVVTRIEKEMIRTFVKQIGDVHKRAVFFLSSRKRRLCMQRLMKNKRAMSGKQA